MTEHAANADPIHDVVVVGARCAGAPTAMLLARMGHDVVVVDRAEFPSDTLSTHAISRSGVVQLQRWGLLDRVLATGAPAIRQVSFHADEVITTKAIKDRAGVSHLVAPRRHLLDHLLVTAAEEAGAEVRTGITVSDVTKDPSGRVNGIVGQDAAGAGVRIRGRVVVGADGLRSRIARAVGAPIIDERHSNGATWYAYVSGLDAEAIEFHLGGGLFAGVFPTNGGEANVWVCGPTSTIGRIGPADERTGSFLELIRHVSPALADRVGRARVTSPVRGFLSMPNQLRQPVGPGWALVGDAGYFRDAVTGHGMSDAFRDAELLARALDAALCGDVDDHEALAGYHAQRDLMVSEIFEITSRLASYPPLAEFIELQKQLSRAIEDEAAFLAALSPVSARPSTRAA